LTVKEPTLKDCPTFQRRSFVYAVDCLGAERKGHTPSEAKLQLLLKEELENCKGKFVVTTYSSNVARVNPGFTSSGKSA